MHSQPVWLHEIDEKADDACCRNCIAPAVLIWEAIVVGLNFFLRFLSLAFRIVILQLLALRESSVTPRAPLVKSWLMEGSVEEALLLPKRPCSTLWSLVRPYMPQWHEGQLIIIQLRK